MKACQACRKANYLLNTEGNVSVVLLECFLEFEPFPELFELCVSSNLYSRFEFKPCCGPGAPGTPAFPGLVVLENRYAGEIALGSLGKDSRKRWNRGKGQVAEKCTLLGSERGRWKPCAQELTNYCEH